jgi:hypothetical protein
MASSLSFPVTVLLALVSGRGLAVRYGGLDRNRRCSLELEHLRRVVQRHPPASTVLWQLWPNPTPGRSPGAEPVGRRLESEQIQVGSAQLPWDRTDNPALCRGPDQQDGVQRAVELAVAAAVDSLGRLGCQVAWLTVPPGVVRLAWGRSPRVQLRAVT